MGGTDHLTADAPKWRFKLAKIMSSSKLMYIVTTILLADAIILCAENVILYQVEPYISSVYCSPEGIQNLEADAAETLDKTKDVAPAAAPAGEKTNATSEKDEEDGGRRRLLTKILPEGNNVPEGCTVEVYDALPYDLYKTYKVLSEIGLALLCLLELELLLVLLNSGPKVFCSKALYVLDAFVITMSIFLETAGNAYIQGLDHHHEYDEVLDVVVDIQTALVIILVVWRFMRIIHAVGISAIEVTKKKAKDHAKKANTNCTHAKGASENDAEALIEKKSAEKADEVARKKPAPDAIA